LAIHSFCRSIAGDGAFGDAEVQFLSAHLPADRVQAVTDDGDLFGRHVTDLGAHAVERRAECGRLVSDRPGLSVGAGE
jgi:hypothetical protein